MSGSPPQGLPSGGASVRVSVVSAQSPERLVLVGPGVRLEIDRPPGISPGSSFILSTVNRRGQLFLKLVPLGTSSGTAVIEQRDPVARALASALVASGRGESAALMEQVIARLPRSSRYQQRPGREHLHRQVRASVELADRGFSEDYTHLATLISGIFSGGGGHGSASREHHQEKQPEGNPEDSSLGSYLRRTVSVPDNFLQLYNHILPDAPLHWVTVPLRARQPKVSPLVTVEGVLRVGWNEKKRRSEQAILTVERPGGGRWWFSWSLPDGSLTSWHSRGEAIPQRLLAGLTKSVHTENRKQNVFTDGFPDGEANVPEIDHYG